MAKQKNSLMVNYKDEDDLRQILPATPSYNSHHLGWNGIDFQYHEQPAGEMPENRTNQHVISVTSPIGSGTQERFLDGQKWVGPIEDRQTSLIPANLCHGAAWNALVAVNILILDPQYLAHLAHESVDVDRVELRPILNIFDPVIHDITSLLRLEAKSQNAQSLLYVDGLTTALSAHLLRNYCTTPQQFGNHEDGLSKAKLQQAIDFIQAHSANAVSLEDIATELGMSRYYFGRLFKTSTGISPHKYLIQCRIEQAKLLLLKGKMSTAQVAVEVGFADQSHFNRHFKKFVGISPRQFLM